MKINQINLNLLNPANLAKTDNLQEGKSFVEFLKDSLGEVNDLQHRSDEMAMRFAASDPTVDIHDLMLALEEASIALQLTIEIRNKLLESYQEIMRMQI
jgi:flagellar hook-basal body complex protein FliE